MSGTALVQGKFVSLAKRGLSEDTCRKFNYTVGSISSKPCQIANYNGKDRKVIAQHIRFADKTFIWRGKAKEVGLFGRHLWAKGGRRIVITEGEIDAMSIYEATDGKVASVSVPSGAQSAAKYLKECLEWLESFKEILIAFDADEPGRMAVDSVVNMFTPGKVKIMSYDGYKDANDLYMARGGAAVLQCIYNAQQYRPDGIISGSDLWETIIEEDEEGYTTPYPKLNELTLGLRKKELWMFTAGSGIGKSTIVKEISYFLAQEHGCKLGIMSLEESIKQAARGYLSLSLNRRINLSVKDVKKDMLKSAFKTTVGSGKYFFYDHWGSTQIENLLAKIRYMVVGLGVDFIVLDHISIVVSGLEEGPGESERKMIDRLMTALRGLIEETGVGILAIVHLKRTDKNYNEGGQVSLRDLRGSASLEQISDVVIGLERDQQSDQPNDVTVRVLKNRPVGRTGLADVLTYDSSTGRLHVASERPFERAGNPENDDF